MGIIDIILELFGNFGIEDLIVFLVIILVGFLLIREVITWYYKINKIVDLLQEQNALLKEVVKQRK